MAIYSMECIVFNILLGLCFLHILRIPDDKAEDAILFLCSLCDMCIIIMCGGTGYLVVVGLLPACIGL